MAVNRGDDTQRQGGTPFHAAARCSHNPAAMVAMLETFPPCCFLDKNSNDKFVSELLAICARRGNAEAVGLLIRCGADIEDSKVLRVIVDESVRSPSKFKLFKAVYYTIVDHALLWWCAKHGERLPRPDSKEYQKQQRRTVLHLLTKPSKEDGKSVMEYIISKSAIEFLRTIFHTPGVFRFNHAKDDEEVDVQRYVTYDVTNMTPFTRSAEVTSVEVSEVNDADKFAR